MSAGSDVRPEIHYDNRPGQSANRVRTGLDGLRGRLLVMFFISSANFSGVSKQYFKTFVSSKDVK